MWPVPLRAALLTCALCGALGGCDVRGEPTALSSFDAGRPVQPLVVASTVEVNLGTGYSRTISQGSTWQPVGDIPAGTVYKAKNTVFTVEGTNVHEAYLVVANGKLMGFYLAAEGSYAPLGTPVNLPSQLSKE